MTTADDTKVREAYLKQSSAERNVATKLNEARLREHWVRHPRAFLTHTLPLKDQSQFENAHTLLTFENQRQFAKAVASSIHIGAGAEASIGAVSVGFGMTMSVADFNKIFLKDALGFNVDDNALSKWILANSGQVQDSATQVNALREAYLLKSKSPVILNGKTYSEEFVRQYGALDKVVTATYGVQGLQTFEGWKQDEAFEELLQRFAMTGASAETLESSMAGTMTRDQFLEASRLSPEAYAQFLADIASATDEKIAGRAQAHLQAEEQKAAELAKRQLDEALLSDEERQLRSERALTAEIDRELGNPTTTPERGELLQRKKNEIRTAQQLRRHQKAMADFQSTTSGVTSVLALFDADAANKVNQITTASMQVYHGMKVMSITNKVDWTSIGTVAGGISIAMTLLKSNSGPSPDEIMVGMLNAILKNQQVMMNQLISKGG